MSPTPDAGRPGERALRCLPIGLLAGILLVLLLLLTFFPPHDYTVVAEAARVWRANRLNVYTPDTHGFYLLPWTLYLTVPLSFLPDTLAQALLNTLSILAVSGAVWWIARPGSPWMMAPAIVNPYMGTVLLLGQWDALVLGGIGLGWWGVRTKRPLALGMGLALASTKPTNIWLPCLILLLACGSWPFSRIGRALIIPLLAVGSSFLLVGANWLARYSTMVARTPPFGFDVSLFGTGMLVLQAFVAAAIGLYLLRSFRGGIREIHVNLALTANTLVTPYLVPYHLVTLGPGLAGLLGRNLAGGILVWLLSGLAFLAFIFRWHPHLVLAYPALLFLGLAWYRQRETRQPGGPPKLDGGGSR